MGVGELDLDFVARRLAATFGVSFDGVAAFPHARELEGPRAFAEPPPQLDTDAMGLRAVWQLVDGDVLLGGQAHAYVERVL